MIQSQSLTSPIKSIWSIKPVRSRCLIIMTNQYHSFRTCEQDRPWISWQGRHRQHLDCQWLDYANPWNQSSRRQWYRHRYFRSQYSASRQQWQATINAQGFHETRNVCIRDGNAGLVWEIRQNFENAALCIATTKFKVHCTTALYWRLQVRQLWFQRWKLDERLSHLRICTDDDGSVDLSIVKARWKEHLTKLHKVRKLTCNTLHTTNAILIPVDYQVLH